MFLPANEKGFSFTLEAVASFSILLLILIIPVQEEKSDLGKIYSIQKEHDLIKVWVKTKNFEENALKEDFRKMFPFQKGEIEVEEKKIEIKGEKGKNELKVSGFYYKNGKIREISVKVFI